MISIIPSLDFMRSLCGSYKAEEGSAELRLWSCGYGLALDLRGERKTELVGVIGAFKGAIECFAQVGLPNVLRLVGQKATESSIQFVGDDLPLSFVIGREAGKIHFKLTLDGQEKVSHVFVAA